IISSLDLKKIEWVDGCLKYKAITLKHVKKPWFWDAYAFISDYKYLDKLFKKIFEVYINFNYKGVFKIK
ncbi:MAG: hypothetical protein KAS32_22545, partial [Candidatus Peribacteraceae bacterium]|nr:hypothetical protein [Candidatus Peribacteraceae bacterium]